VSGPGLVVRTVGHGTLEEDAFIELLAGASVARIVDVRRYPGSRRHPHFAREAMERWLPAAGLEYRWLPALGGRRRPTEGSPNAGLHNEQFRAYADHMASREFQEGIAALLTAAAEEPTAVMCAESVWWRCHRRLIADHLVLVAHVRVEHLLHGGQVVAHDPLPGAVVVGDHVEYPPPPQLEV